MVCTVLKRAIPSIPPVYTYPVSRASPIYSKPKARLGKMAKTQWNEQAQSLRQHTARTQQNKNE